MQNYWVRLSKISRNMSMFIYILHICTRVCVLQYMYSMHLYKDIYCILQHVNTVSTQYYSTEYTVGLHTCSLLRNVWIIEDTVVLPTFGHTLRPVSAIVRPLFCLLTLPPCIPTPAPFSGSSFPCCSSRVRSCNTELCSVYICLPIQGSWDAPLSYFRGLVDHWLK